MNKEHKHYEIQSALAAVGQLTESELADLERHAATCTSCRNHLSDMAKISRICFLLHASKVKERAPEGMQERFIERAAHAGIPIRNLGSGLLSLRYLRLAAIAFFFCIAASFGWKTFHVRNTSPQSVSGTTSSVIQPAGTIGATEPSLWVQQVTVTSAKVTQPHPQPVERHVLPITTRRLQRPIVHSAPNVEPTAQRPRFLILHGDPDWSQPAPVVLYDTARFAPASNLLPDAEFLTCIKHTGECKLGVRAFRMDPQMMSFAYSETPASPYGGTSFTTLKFAAPEFHLRSTRSW